MSFRDRRPRTSTLVLTGLFIAVVDRYLYVREPQATGSPTPSPTSPSPSPTLSGANPSPTETSPAATAPASVAPSGTTAQP